MKVAGGQNVNQLLTNSVPNAKRLIIIPMLNASSNNGYSPLQSPFTTEPATSSPQLSLINFNVKVSGTSIYQENINYEWQNFLQECRPANGIDGNLYTGLSCGLISQRDWQKNKGN